MIELVANGLQPPTNPVSITLSQDGTHVDINLDGELIAFFVVRDGKIKLNLCEGLDLDDVLAEKVELNENGQIVAD